MIDEKLAEHYKSLSYYGISEQFRFDCENGNLENIKYTLLSPEMKHINVLLSVDDGFIQACKYGHFELVKFFAASKELKTHADISKGDCAGFRFAAGNGYLEIAKYLLTSP